MFTVPVADRDGETEAADVTRGLEKHSVVVVLPPAVL